MDAIPTVEEWCIWALEHNVPGISITDHGSAISLSDIIKFPKFIEKYNKKNNTIYPLDSVIGIPGCEFYLKLKPEDKKHYHFNIWAVSTEGYFNLLKLASLAFNDTVSFFGNVKPRITIDQVLNNRKGLKFGTACIASPMGDAIFKDDRETAEKMYRYFIDTFGEDLYIEFHSSDLTHKFDSKTKQYYPNMKTILSPDGNLYKAYNRFLFEMVGLYGGKPIPVTDAHFINKEDKIIQDILLKAGNKNGWYFHDSYHQLSVKEIFSKLKEHLPEITPDVFNKWCDNSNEMTKMAKTIKVEFEYHLPKIEIPKTIIDKTSNYEEQTYYLMMKKIKQHGRWKDIPEYIERFKHELSIIKDNGTINFIPYFLLYEDICYQARKMGTLQNIGRGSCGGSLVAYYLKIIHIDPIKNNLPFERFLSLGRIKGGSFPDIDLDLQDRKPIFNYLKKKYGLGFAQIGTFSRMKIKNAIKDSMWALYGRNRNDFEIDSLCKTIEDSPQGIEEYDFVYGYTDQEGEYHKGHIEENAELHTFFVRYPDVQKTVNKLIGSVRGWSRHASGVVICDKPLNELGVPTFIVDDADIGEMAVTQYDAKMVESCGLLKADVLSVLTLNAVKDCIDLVKERTGKDFLEEDEDGVALLYRLPDDDSVYDEFYEENTESSFQFNTALIRQHLKDFNPRNKKDLAILTALYRPGAMDAIFLDTTAADYYLSARQGNRSAFYLHPDLEPILKDTYGCMIYQESVMEVLVKIAGYTMEEADLIRSAIGKKKRHIILDTFRKIREVVIAKGWTEEQANSLCCQIEAFSAYGFNKCLSGDEVIYKFGVNKNNKAYSIREYYKFKNTSRKEAKVVYTDKEFHMWEKINRSGFGTALSLNEEKKLIKNKIKDIRYEGIRPVYRIKLENGAFVECTGNHKFPTLDGDKETSELKIGDCLFVSDKYEKSISYRNFTSRLAILGGTNCPQKGEQGFQKTENSDYKKWKIIGEKLKNENNYCQMCKMKIIRKELHHVDNNYLNNSVDNLLVLCSSCHKKEHYKNHGRKKLYSKGVLTKMEKIISISYIKNIDVYDIEMENPYHTFLLNSGIVSCNSHAAMYSYLGYITMYLKHHYKLEWWTSILNSHIGKEDKLRSDIRLLGDIILPVDINKSSDRFTIKDEKIVTPLGCVKGLGEVGVSSIIETTPYVSVEDFMERIDHRCVNIGTVAALVKARAMDSLFDSTMPYVEARKGFLDRYIKIKEKMNPGKKYSFDEKFINVNALDLFLHEKDTNLSFNKNLLENEEILDILMQRWPSLKRTKSKAIPLIMDNKVFVLLNIDLAQGMLEKKEDKDRGMILIFEESSFKEGISKKNGRPWKKMSVTLSDGYKEIEAIDWDANSALGWPKGSLVYVKGQLKQGFMTPICIVIKEIQKIDCINLRNGV